MADDAGPIRIWYQSFIDPDDQAPYFRQMQARFEAVKSPSTEIEMVGVTPPDRHFHALTEFRCADQTIRNAIKAQEQGFDAFVIGHFPDGGLLEARGTVDIPVIGLGEANLLHACTLGRKIGLVTINPVFVPIHEAQITAYGLDSRVVGVAAIKADVQRFMAGLEDDTIREEIRRDFETRLRPLVDAGADVLIPSGGMPMLLLSYMQPFTVDGALVVEGIATVIKAAEMAVALHRITGNAASRRGIYARASGDAIADFLGPRA